jgi:serine/threonine-protein kinase
MSNLPRLLGGRYEVGELLGRGGMAEVHLGHDTRLGRQVAIKMLRNELARDHSFVARFRREAQSSAALNHASIVAVYDSGEDHMVESGGATVAVPYMVMEYVDGRTLREVLTEQGRFRPENAARVTEGVLDALAYSHRMGIVHRDIKPANVMLCADGSVKVMDFGIARAIADANATMTQTQAVLGTAQYLSPEQAQGQPVDARSDLYSTGCMLFELLTGRPPFVADTPVAIAYQHVGQAPVPPSSFEPSVTRDMDAIVLHALEKRREDRYQDADSFRADVQAARLGRPVSAAAGAALAGVTAGVVTERLGGLGAEPTEVYAVAGGTAATAGAVPPPAAPTADDGTAALEPLGDDDDGKRRRGWPAYLLLGVATIAALTLLFFGVRSYLDQRAAEQALVTVPRVIGLTQPVAEANLRRAGLVPEATRAPSEDVAAGTVSAQEPEAARRVERDSTVQITVSSGPAAVAVPSLAGRTVGEARGLLEDVGLVLGDTEDTDSATVEKGRIISSSPAADTRVAPGTRVTVRVSTGQVPVPNVVGQSQNEAFTTLNGAGLTPRTQYRQTASAREGTVVAQDPRSGKVDAGSTVTITVAQAPPPTVTPTTVTPTPRPTTPTPSSPSSPTTSPSPTSPSPTGSPTTTP